MIRIVRSLVVKRHADVVFALATDPIRFRELLSGVTRVEQRSAEGRAIGARYLILMKVGPIDAGGILRITEWRPPHRIAWISDQGVVHSGSVDLSPSLPGGTEVRIELSYAVPGPRLAGWLAEHWTRHIVERHLHATLLSVKRAAEFDSPGA